MSTARLSLALTCLLASLACHAASLDEQKHACRSDALRLCSADVPNRARITRCMKAHYDQLSPPCKAMFDKPSGSDRGNRQKD